MGESPIRQGSFQSTALSFTLLEDLQNGTLAGIAPNLVYTPNEIYFGANEFSFIVNDGELNTARAK